MPPGLQSKRRVGQETGTVALKTRLRRWNTLIVAVGQNVGVMRSGHEPALVHTFEKVI
jgi:hypothetical protein